MNAISRRTMSFAAHLFSQTAIVDPTTTFAGKNILVTGANSGLGLEAAAKFSALNANRVILAVRDLDKGHSAQRFIQGRTGRQGGLEVWKLDLNSYASICSFSSRVEQELDHLDVAVLNAGVFSISYQASSYNWEQTLQVNSLSTVLLATLLLPKLLASQTNGQPAVLEFVTSRRVEAVELSAEELQGNLLTTLNDPKSFQASLQYRKSKFITMCAMRRLASMMDPSKVVVSAVCPGAAASNLSRGWTGPVASFIKYAMSTVMLRTPEQGARSLVSGASLGAAAHGKFWYDDAVHEFGAGKAGEELSLRVWNEVIDALSKDLPNFSIKSILDGTQK